jgi:hypothetical protein
MLPGQKLILARIETPQPPPLPVMAKSAPTEAEPEPLYLTIILWILVILARPAIRKSRNVWPQIAALIFLASIFINVILENIAAGYIEKMLGA